MDTRIRHGAQANCDAGAVANNFDAQCCCGLDCSVLQACAKAEAKGKKQWLGLLYDRLARQTWAKRASHNEVRVSPLVCSAFLFVVFIFLY